MEQSVIAAAAAGEASDMSLDTVHSVLEAHFETFTMPTITLILSKWVGREIEAVSCLYKAMNSTETELEKYLSEEFEEGATTSRTRETLMIFCAHASGNLSEEDPMLRQCKIIFSGKDLKRAIGNYFRKKCNDFLSEIIKSDLILYEGALKLFSSPVASSAVNDNTAPTASFAPKPDISTLGQKECDLVGHQSK